MAEWSIAPVADDDAASIEGIRALFIEYHEWLGDAVCSTRLAEEIATLPGPYAAPNGRLFLAWDGSHEPLGCIGVRPHQGDACEIKRLYVRPAARGGGVGIALVTAAVQAARDLGYSDALVTTLPETMPVAAAMYEKLGFETIEPFLDFSAVAEGVAVLYLRLRLR
jgi:carbonic anhydrase